MQASKLQGTRQQSFTSLPFPVAWRRTIARARRMNSVIVALCLNP